MASPYLQSIGTQAFYNVPEIKVFDASNVISPSNAGSFLPNELFAKDDNLVDENGETIESQLQAVLLPQVLESGTQNYYIQAGAFKNNPNLKSVGTKNTLQFEEPAKPFSIQTRADDYLAQIKNPGFIAPARLNVLGQYAFENTGIEVVDMSKIIAFSNDGNLGSSLNTVNGTYGHSSFKDTTNLKKVTLPA